MILHLINFEEEDKYNFAFATFDIKTYDHLVCYYAYKREVTQS
jgi:hypothetical protein